MPTIVLPLSIAALVLGAITLMVLMVGTSSSKTKRDDLAKRVQEYSGGAPIARQGPSDSLMTKVRASSSAKTAKLLNGRGWATRLAVGLLAAGLSMKPEEWVLLCLGSGVIGGALMFVLGGASVPPTILGIGLGLVLPMLFLRIKTSRRQAQFVSDLPDALTALASGLSGGASLPQAIVGVAQENTGALAEELNRAIIETRLGTSIPDALGDVAQRMRCEDLGMVVMAIRLQSAHGGNLGELLNTVATTLRERVQMRRHVAALAAEGKMSIYVLIALPIGLLMYMSVVKRDYFEFFISTPLGLAMLGGGATAMLLGYLWARSIVRIEV